MIFTIMNNIKKLKKPILLKYIKEQDYENKDTCPFEVFEKAVKKFPLPSKYVDEYLLESIYNQYKVLNFK